MSTSGLNSLRECLYMKISINIFLSELLHDEMPSNLSICQSVTLSFSSYQNINQYS